MSQILLVEDDVDVARAIRLNLLARQHDVHHVVTGTEALARAASAAVDLVILDLGLPDLDGLEVIAGLRAAGRTPILVLSARDRQNDKVGALDAGADDYLTKPFGMGELLARVRAALRRAGPDDGPGIVETVTFRLDLAAKVATRGSGEVHLTPTEWHLIEILARQPGRLVTQQQLLEEVWGPAYQRETNYLRVYLSQLRRKLEADPARPRHLITLPGLGYRFDP